MHLTNTNSEENLQLVSELQRKQCYGVLSISIETLGDLKFLSYIRYKLCHLMYGGCI